MKKIIAIALIAVMILAMTACSINSTEVSVLWSGANDEAVVPNSLINAMDRALYIENISYKHYAASGDQAAQTKQAEDCLNAGCAALMVELVDASAAQTIVDMAKAKNVPVVFFGCHVDEAVVSSYDKCAVATTDEATLSTVYDGMVGTYVTNNVKAEPTVGDMDINNDNKINYLVLGDVDMTLASVKISDEQTVELVQVSAALEELTVKTEEVEKTTFFFFKSVEEYAHLATADGTPVEMILMGDDTATLETLIALQAKEFNATKLATHFMPVFTVGADADYKAHVMKDLPAEAEARKAYLESVRVLIDMTGISQEEWTKWEKKEDSEVDSMIYNTLNQVDAGKLSGTAVEDYDSLAVAAAELTGKLLKGEALDKAIVEVSYISYAG